MFMQYVYSSAGKSLEIRLVPRAPLTDEEFKLQLDAGSLCGFGHEVKIRGIYLMLLQHKRSSDISFILDKLQELEKDNYHASINYFWVHMVDYYMKAAIKKAKKDSSASSIFSYFSAGSQRLDISTKAGHASETPVAFSDFFRLPLCQPLRNSLLYEKYYSHSAVDDPNSAMSFVLPDLKQLPSVVI